jgi:hypothetical protein
MKQHPLSTRTLRFIFAGALAFISAAASLQAQSAAVTPLADTFVDSANPGNNYGVAGALGIAPAGASNGEFDSFIEFNLSSAKTGFDQHFGVGNWTIQSITLQLTAAVPNNPLFNGNGSPSVNTAGQFTIAYTPNNSWLEGSGTPNIADTSATDLNFNNHLNYVSAADEALGTFNFSGATSGATVYTLTLTPNFLAAAAAGADVSLYLSAADSQVNYLFNSGNFMGAASTHPTLTVNAVPEPSATLLLGGGLAFFARRRRARR